MLAAVIPEDASPVKVADGAPGSPGFRPTRSSFDGADKTNSSIYRDER